MIIHIPKIIADGSDCISDLTINLIGHNQAKIKFDIICNGEVVPVYYVVTNVGQWQLDVKSKSVKTSVRLIDMSNRKPFFVDINISLQGVVITKSGLVNSRIEMKKGSDPSVVLRQIMMAIR